MPRFCLLVGVALAVLPLASCSKEAKKTRVSRRAESYFAAGQFDNARIEYLNLLRLDSRSTAAYARLGSIWLEEGAPLRAAPFLVKARDLAPDDLENRLKLGRVLLGLGRRADGFSEAMYVLDHAPNHGMAARLAAEAAQTPEDWTRFEHALARMSNQNDGTVQLAIATGALRRGDRDTARHSAGIALTLTPQSAPAHLLMANLWLLEKQTAKAGDEFKIAAELSPPRSAERLRYAQFQVQSGAQEEAIKTLSAITSEAPDFLPAWLLLGNISLGQKKYDEALKFLANILNRDPDNIDATLVQARARTAKGEIDKSVQALERLDGKFPNFPPIKYELARCYLQKDNAPQAIAVLNQALTANPEFVDGAVLLADINLRSGKAKAVIDTMRPLVGKHPELKAAKLLLADAYRVLGQLDDAAAIFREELKTAPDNAEAYAALGIILRQQKKNDEARQVLEKARQLAPQSPVPLMQLVDMALAGGDFATAQRLVDEQLQKTPDAAFIHFLAGKVCATQKKWESAEASLGQALKLNPNFSAAYALLATVYTASNKVPDAIRQLEAIVARAPKDARTLMSLGVLYEKVHNFEKAREVYEKVLTIAPEFAPALNNLAFIYVEHLNQLDRAYQLAQKARALQPGDGSIADTLGWVLYKKRNYQEALALISDALAKSPNEPEIQYHLAMCHYMMGATEPAKLAFEQALKSPVDFASKPDAERRLALVSQERSRDQLSIADLSLIVGQQPDDVLARMQLAERYQAAQAFKEAAAQYQEVLKLNPRLVVALVKLADLYSTALNDPEKAVEYAKNAREVSPGDAQTTLVLGRIAYKAANYSWAYGLLKQSCDQLPNDVGAHHALACAAFSMGKVPEASEQLEWVIKLAPDHPLAGDAKTWLAMIHLIQNPPADAVERVAAVLRNDPNNPPAKVAEAVIAQRRGDGNRAIAAYEQVLTRFPDFAPAQKQLASLYARQPADLQRAYDLGMKARKNFPEDPELARTLADISYQRKEYPRALELLEESARKEPLDPDHLYYMGICSLQTKAYAQAREALTQALARGLQDPLAAEARRALQDSRLN